MRNLSKIIMTRNYYCKGNAKMLADPRAHAAAMLCSAEAENLPEAVCDLYRLRAGGFRLD